MSVLVRTCATRTANTAVSICLYVLLTDIYEMTCSLVKKLQVLSYIKHITVNNKCWGNALRAHIRNALHAHTRNSLRAHIRNAFVMI